MCHFLEFHKVFWIINEVGGCNIVVIKIKMKSIWTFKILQVWWLIITELFSVSTAWDTWMETSWW